MKCRGHKFCIHFSSVTYIPQQLENEVKRQCCHLSACDKIVMDTYLHMIVSPSSDNLSCTYMIFKLCDPTSSSDEPSVLSDM
jgi:hypothetical protein